MVRVELNVGLLIGHECDLVNTWSRISKRYLDIKEKLHARYRCHCRFHAGDEPTLVAVLFVDSPHGFTKAMCDLCDKFQQECVAVYFPVTGEGKLIGPRAHAWGEFHIDKFARF